MATKQTDSYGEKWTRAELEAMTWEQMSEEQAAAYDRMLDKDVERAEQLQAKQLFKPRAWRPDKGEQMSGVVVGVREEHTDGMVAAKAPPCTVYTIRSQGKQWDVWAMQTVLRNLMEEHEVKRGSIVAIRYNGIVNGRGGEYHSYDLDVA